jgi:O-antigen/teichoic acid export membrane protein
VSVAPAGRPALRRLLAWRPSGAWVAGGVPVNTALAGVRTLVGGVVALALLPLLIDRIGAAPTGLFVFATTLTGYFSAVEYGIGMSVTKYVAEHRATGEKERLGSVLRASLAFLLAVGVLIAATIALLGVLGGQALFGAGQVRHEATPTLLVAAGIALFYWPSRIGTAALRGLERYDLGALIEIVSAVVTFSVIYLASSLTHSVPLLAGLFGAPLVLQGVSAGALAWPHLDLRPGVGRWRGAHLRATLGFSAGMFVLGASDIFIYESDRIVIAAFLGSAAIVVYEVALRPHNGIRLISGLAGSALLSTSARLLAQGRTERLRELALISSLYGVVLTAPLVVLTFLLARPIVEAWVGHGYGRYAVYVQIFVSYWFLGASTGPMGVAIYGSGRIRTFVWLTIVGSVVTLPLSIGLVVAWGTVGVIWGTVIPFWIGMPIWLRYALPHLQIAWARYAREVLVPGYLPILAWAVPVVLLSHVLRPQGLVGLGAFCAFALAALWLGCLPLLRARWRRMWVEERIVAGALT